MSNSWLGLGLTTQMQPGITYYVSAAGDDGNDGLTPETAWQTITKVNAETYEPGDRILFEGGETFSGTLAFDGDSWTPGSSRLVTIGSYGIGRAIISSGTAAGCTILNNGGVILRDLEFVGAGTHAVDGVLVKNTLEGNGKFAGVRLQNLELSGYGRCGILVTGGYGPLGSSTDTAGFSGVRIQDCEVHDCTNIYTGDGSSGGIIVQGYYGFSGGAEATNLDIIIRDCLVFDCPGKAGAASHTGNGIVIGDSQGGLIEDCEVYGCGHLSNFSSEPVGIWTYDSDSITIRGCSSHDNLGTAGGFDIDGGCTNCLIEYCFSANNAAYGFLAYQYSDPGFVGAWEDNIFRFCISENDSIGKASLGGFEVESDGSALTGLAIHNCVIYQDSGNSRCMSIGVPIAADALIANNIFYQASAGTGYLVDAASTNPSNARFRGNCYYTAGTFRIRWNGTTYNTLAAWRAATTQEVHDSEDVGTDVDPRLTDPGNGLAQPNAYLTTTFSQMRDAGLDLLAEFGVNPGARDYFGNAIPVGGGFDIGAHDGAFTADTVAPSVPANLSATAVSASQIDLEWDASTDNDAVAGYKIYRDNVLVDTSPTNSYSDTGLDPSTEYEYEVSAFDAADNESARSAPDSATTEAAGGFETETDTLLAAMSVEPDSTRKGHINTLIASLKTAGVWTKLDALWIIAAHDAQAARLNWKTPGTFDLTLQNSPTFTTDRHYATNGTDNYLITNFNPSTAGGNFTQNAASHGAWNRLDFTNRNIGWATNNLANPRDGSNRHNVRVNTGTSLVSGADTSGSSIGFVAGNRSASTAQQVYFNGAQQATGSQTSATLVNETFRLGHNNTSFFAVQVAAAFVGGNLTSTEHGNLYTALNTYMTAVGAA